MARGFGAGLTYSTLSVLRCWDVESDLWREASRLIRPVDSSPTCPPPPVVRRRWLRQLSCGFGSRHSCCLPPGKRRMWIRDQPCTPFGQGVRRDRRVPRRRHHASKPSNRPGGRHCIAVCFNASCLIANNISICP